MGVESAGAEPAGQVRVAPASLARRASSSPSSPTAATRRRHQPAHERRVQRERSPAGDSSRGRRGRTAVVRIFYNDEHALTLGVRQVVRPGAGPDHHRLPTAPLTRIPGSATDPKTGTNELAGPQSGLDVSLRPMWPALFITDVTADPQNRSGDWQMGGRPLRRTRSSGPGKAAVRTVDNTTNPDVVTITPDKDPMKNNWNLGGGDPVPAGLRQRGLRGGGAVERAAGARPLLPAAGDGARRRSEQGRRGFGRSLRALLCAGGTGAAPGSDAGAPPPPSCPAGTMACSQDEVYRVACPSTTVCANGCCVPGIP